MVPRKDDSLNLGHYFIMILSISSAFVYKNTFQSWDPHKIALKTTYNHRKVSTLLFCSKFANDFQLITSMVPGMGPVNFVYYK